MESIKTLLENILRYKNNIKLALENKGVDMTAVPFRDYASKIEAIKYSEKLSDLLKSKLRAIGWTNDDILYLESLKWWKQKYDDLYTISDGELDQYDLDKEDGISIAEFIDRDYSKTFNMRFAPKIIAETGNLNNVFKNLHYLEAIPAIDRNIESLDATFENCNNLKYVPQINSSNCSIFRDCFKNCYNLQVIDIDFSKATNMIRTFENCTQVHSISDIDFDKITSSVDIFKGCYMLTNVKIKNLSQDISLKDCGRISKESLLYMFENAKDALITVTLNYATYYYVYDGDADLMNAVASKGGSLIVKFE